LWGLWGLWGLLDYVNLSERYCVELELEPEAVEGRICG
jgi:hypothetical protein